MLSKLLKAFQERQEKKQEQEEAQEVREALRSAVENQFMTELLLGEVEDEAAQRYLTHLPHEFNGVYVLVITSPKKENEGSLSGFEADPTMDEDLAGIHVLTETVIMINSVLEIGCAFRYRCGIGYRKCLSVFQIRAFTLIGA